MGLTEAHWLTLAVLTGSLSLGVAIAIIHDQIYEHFDRKFVEAVSQQEWLGRFGTASAFLVKTLFSTSIGTACVQRLWWTLRNKSISIKTIDSSLSLVKNPFALKNQGLFKEVPLIVLLAGLSWLMPVAALFAPPTLTVLQNTGSSTSFFEYPIPAINFSAAFDVLGGGAPYFYDGPQPDLERMGLQVALTGQPLTFSSPVQYQNASYETQFWGPYFSCQNANQTIYNIVNETTTALGNSPLVFAAWTPYNDTTGPSRGAPNNLTEWITGSGALSTVDSISPTGAGLFVAALEYSFDNGSPLLQTMSVYECHLYNASYNLTFEFLNGFGTYSVNNISMDNAVGFPGGPLDTPAISYISMLDSLGQVLFGAIRTNQYNQMFVKETDVLKTSLVTAKDFPSNFNFLHRGQTNKTLGSAIEELMMNMTVSLFPSSQYLADKGSYPIANVSVQTLQNVYHYARWQLLTSYGAAAIVTLSCVIVGLWSIHSNSAAYSNNFSTILRVTRYSHLDKFITGSDTSGVSPTPAYIGKVKVSLERLDDGISSLKPRYAILSQFDMTESVGQSGESTYREDVDMSTSSLPLLRAR